MGAKLALAALISLGLAIMSIATVHVVLAESSANTAANSLIGADCACIPGVEGSASEAVDRRGHVAWNAASWLIGLALVVSVGRRSSAQPAPS